MSSAKPGPGAQVTAYRYDVVGNTTIAANTYDPLDRPHLVDHGGSDRTASGTGSVSGTVRDDPWGTAVSVTGSWPELTG